MSMTAIKRIVNNYFKLRRKTLRTLTNKGIADDDYFELYILTGLLRRIKPAPKVRRPDNGCYVVAASPSSSWHAAAYFELTSLAGERMGIRSGLKVHGAGGRGQAELDVVLVGLPGCDPNFDT